MNEEIFSIKDAKIPKPLLVIKWRNMQSPAHEQQLLGPRLVDLVLKLVKKAIQLGPV